ncbi:MAG TPA: hypothetical protein VL475_14700 [Planctomycetaceae bacterium]|nr:hypothetical protein [Planctomycetaceae bacterium]
MFIPCKQNFNSVPDSVPEIAGPAQNLPACVVEPVDGTPKSAIFALFLQRGARNSREIAKGEQFTKMHLFEKTGRLLPFLPKEGGFHVFVRARGSVSFCNTFRNLRTVRDRSHEAHPDRHVYAADIHFTIPRAPREDRIAPSGNATRKKFPDAALRVSPARIRLTSDRAQNRAALRSFSATECASIRLVREKNDASGLESCVTYRLA